MDLEIKLWSSGASPAMNQPISIEFADAAGSSLFAPLLLRLSGSLPLLLGFLTLALRFGLGHCSCLTLLLRCQPLFPCLLQLAVSFRLGCSSIFLGRSAIFIRFKFGLLHTQMPNECVAAHANQQHGHYRHAHQRPHSPGQHCQSLRS
jgi:hypothetical protein